jgi:hypothetical protein
VRLTLTTLDPDLLFPDSTFVEDAAVLSSQGAVLTRPGAPTRECRSLMRWINLLRWISWVGAATVFLANFLHPLSDAMLCFSMGLVCFSIGLSFSVRYLKQQVKPPPSTA